MLTKNHFIEVSIPHMLALSRVLGGLQKDVKPKLSPEEARKLAEETIKKVKLQKEVRLLGSGLVWLGRLTSITGASLFWHWNSNNE